MAGLWEFPGGKIEAEVPAAKAQWTVRKGIEQLYAAFSEYGLDVADLTGPRFQRLKRISELRDEGRLDNEIRLVPAGDMAAADDMIAAVRD